MRQQVWVLHWDGREGYRVTVCASETGAYAEALEQVRVLYDAGHYQGDRESVRAVLESGDGRAALAEHDAAVCNIGLDDVGGGCLWITHQDVGA